MSTSLQKQVGKAIRAHRERLGISQEAFADRIGMHRAYYGAVERGLRNLTLRNIQRIAQGLEVAPAALFVTPAQTGK
jgi:transcriptional regulator with XRE-family HTH domain